MEKWIITAYAGVDEFRTVACAAHAAHAELGPETWANRQCAHVLRSEHPAVQPRCYIAVRSHRRPHVTTSRHLQREHLCAMSSAAEVAIG